MIMRDLSNRGSSKKRRNQIKRRRKKQAKRVTAANKHTCSCECAKCNGMTDAEFDQGIKDNIKKHGLHLNGITADPVFIYSTGLAAHNLPEIIIFGLPMEFAGTYINKIGTEMIQGKEFALHTPYFGYVDEDYPFMFIELPQTAIDEHMNVTKKFYSGFKAWQFVWTDTDSKFPWQYGFEEKFKNMQPVLGETPI